MNTNLSVEIEPGILKLSEGAEQRVKMKVIELYTKAYYEVVTEFERNIVKGTGYKTNRYGEAKMNLAYNYINHPNFVARATENGRSFDYYQSVWSVACDRVAAIINEGVHDGVQKWRLKLDHSGLKNDDFKGRLILFKNQQNWSRENGYEDMRP